MKSFSTLAISAASIVAFSSLANAIKIDTPMSVVECQPVALSWHEGSTTGSVYISAVPGMDITATPLVQFTPQPGAASGKLTWPQVNITAGTTFTLVVNDAVGQPNYSSQVTVLKGNSQCNAVAGGAAGAGNAAGAGGATGAAGSSTAAASSGGAATPPTAAAGTTPASNKSSSTASNKTSSSAPSNNTTSKTTTTTSGAPASISQASPLLAAVVLLASVALSASLL